MHPVLFKIGNLTVTSYGVLVAAAFFIGFSLLFAEAKRKKFYPEKIPDLELCILVSAVLGARILHVLADFSYYANRPAEIIMVWRGGLAIYGGIAAGLFVGWLFILKNRMPLWETADFVMPYIALGQSIGRIGCFLNGCCFGKEAIDAHLSVSFPGEMVLRYPTQVYAALALLCIFIVLKFAGKKSFFSGCVIGLYLVLYSLQRFFIDFFRGDNPIYLFGLTISQMMSIVVFLAGAFILIARYKKTK